MALARLGFFTYFQTGFSCDSLKMDYQSDANAGRQRTHRTERLNRSGNVCNGCPKNFNGLLFFFSLLRMIAICKEYSRLSLNRRFDLGRSLSELSWFLGHTSETHRAALESLKVCILLASSPYLVILTYLK